MQSRKQPYNPAAEDPVLEAMKQLGEISPTLVSSLGAFFGGALLLLDDYKDFGKMGDERDPPVPHHWLWGVLAMVGGVAGINLSLLNLLSSTPELAEKIREKIEEERLVKKALPPDYLEKVLKQQT